MLMLSTNNLRKKWALGEGGDLTSLGGKSRDHGRKVDKGQKPAPPSISQTLAHEYLSGLSYSPPKSHTNLNFGSFRLSNNLPKPDFLQAQLNAKAPNIQIHL